MERLSPIKSSSKSISNKLNLCKTLDITIDELDSALTLPNNQKYITAYIDKPNGEQRKIHKPHYKIRKIQRRINNRIFKRLVLWPSYIYGCIPNEKDETTNITIQARDYVSCAAEHCTSTSLLKIDIKDFFDNISFYLVNDMFLNFFKYPTEVSKILSEICCYKGNLIQGALTSSYIAALCLWDCEEKLVARLKRKGLRYTRLVDDITISSTISNYQFDYAISCVTNTLNEKELPINPEKTSISYESITPLMVHGMRINFPEPRYPANEVKKLRAAVHNIERLASEPGYRITFAYRKDFSRCMGRINKLKRVKHSSHGKLVSRLQKILPLPAKVDIKRAKIMVDRLVKDFDEKKDTYWYHRRFYRAHDRLNVLQRTYNKTSKILREKLKGKSPTYDNK
ncbi:reverse transcriptase family protein [Colwellia sp. E2M01]|uniref:reverse transcriptase family protein n=1 Tax=Colwellia sp. E2M01 TaxID=2841561 RepID=UPI001C08D690|nr:reverse transcriptase family protein [Colwellia sp. E2M01]MBU2872365.1 reverse transcriptase family protein [Colwellia sp. E2M01]